MDATKNKKFIFILEKLLGSKIRLLIILPSSVRTNGTKWKGFDYNFSKVRELIKFNVWSPKTLMFVIP